MSSALQTAAYRLPIPQHAPFTIGYTFENKPQHYLSDVVGTLANGQPFIAEAGINLRGLEAESPVSPLRAIVKE